VAKRARRPYLMDGPHWEVGPIRDLDVFFPSLPDLLPADAVLCLAGGAGSAELRRFFGEYGVAGSGHVPMPAAFRKARRVLVDRGRMEILADMALRHAEPEIAAHIGAFAGGAPSLEWFDVPDRPDLHRSRSPRAPGLAVRAALWR
jgi:hypothetical protein